MSEKSKLQIGSMSLPQRAKDLYATTGGKHTMILGSSGQGKSVLLQAEARRLGITAEELVQRLEPTDEQQEHQRMSRIKENQAEEQRMNAVREAYWANTPNGHFDLAQLRNVLVVSAIVDEPTPEQVKSFFMKLPNDIFGAALSWGFDDTEVRDRIYEFVEQDKDAVLEAIGSQTRLSPE